MLKVKFVGASEGITGSCSWLWHTETNTQFLVDCGMHQGTHEEEWKNYQPFEFDPKQIQYVLLTHAHIDHCGLLPKLIKGGFKGWVYCTQATKEIAELMLMDAAKIGDLFQETDVRLIKWHVIDAGDFSWNKTLRLADGLSTTFKRSSHVLGACGISVTWSVNEDSKELKSIYFSGDIGCQLDDNAYLPLMKSDHQPYPKTNYIVMESTYGAVERDPGFKDANNRIDVLGKIICEAAYQKGGTVLIPAFSFHRTQEIIMDLLCWQWSRWPKSEYAGLMGGDKLKEDGTESYEKPLRILCDSPLGHRINEVYASQISKRLSNGKYQYLNKELAGRLSCSEGESSKLFSELVNTGCIYRKGHLIRCLTPENRKKTRYPESNSKYSVIIASSGMCDNGPVVEYIKKMRRDPKNTIVLTGYQSSGSLGRQLLEQSELEGVGSKQAQVINMSGYYSGHADQAKLLDYVFSLGSYSQESKPAHIFINHGIDDTKNALKLAIQERSGQKLHGDREVKSVEIAKKEWFDLNAGAYIDSQNEHSDQLMGRLASIEDKLSRLTDEISGLKLARY
ncbi:MBL fold metallo-hydrolase [Neptunomonas japonica]|uniref:Metallo-beta-lactamase family protein n=1 Tax=Neptunomonas japonica JAMM 1380 TaxID=1441457 RepID=A0A7R6PNN8_9GAMM|nr:MBL fold metallo-hydrolase [Neptunomonas japonica]BBB31496.1 metallo-beta-lactamase family protein [Neptunomonas japonica JAMM 1380]